MDAIFYILIFAIGILFGSFYTLAVYRIPKTEDITHTHSYCPNCGHKLGFWDLIPLFSYIFLGAKCRYCKEKIRPRYFILELISGLFFVCVAYLMDFNIQNLTLTKILDFSFLVLYFTFIVLMAGIDKEKRKIEKSVTMYGIIISIMYMIYLCIIEKASIYRYGIYLICYIIMLIIDTLTLKKTAKNYYINGIILTIITMAIFTEGEIALYSLLIVLVSIVIYMAIEKFRIRKKKNQKVEIGNQITIGYSLAVANVSILILALIMNKFFI